jgi:hypothetical protein
MANRVLTQKILRDVKKHGDNVLEGMSEAMQAGALKWNDVCFETVLENDFGHEWKRRIRNADNDAMEAVMTSGTFNKMILRTIRHALMENPKEEFMLANMVTAESRGECEGNFRDWGAFSDIQVHEVCELEAGPLYGLATDYQDHPNGKQYSAGLAWTREALCADPNGYLMKQVPKLRDAHFDKQENLLLDAFIGYTPSYDRSGTLYDTYYEADAADTPFDADGAWVNASGDGFTCGSDLDNVRDMFDDMVDLVHGRPVITNTDNMQVITSVSKARSVRPILLSTEVRCDEACDTDAGTCTYIMTGDVARGGMQANVTPYRRWVTKIMERWDLTAAQAEEWIWFGPNVNEFLGWTWQISPEITRCAIAGDDCMKRIVAKYTSLSKGYAYIKDPMKGLILTGAGSTSA